jgi:hypothetical protein
MDLNRALAEWSLQAFAYGVLGLVLLVLLVTWLWPDASVRQDLLACFEEPGLEASVVELAMRLHRAPPDLYPALYALEANGTLESRFEDGAPPRRRLYRRRTACAGS